MNKTFKTHAKAIVFMRTKKEATLSGKKGAWVVEHNEVEE